MTTSVSAVDTRMLVVSGPIDLGNERRLNRRSWRHFHDLYGSAEALADRREIGTHRQCDLVALARSEMLVDQIHLQVAQLRAFAQIVLAHQPVEIDRRRGTCASGQKLVKAAAAAAGLLKALANEQRPMILCNLVEGPLSVGELNERLDLSQSALSQHLAVLREASIVATTREAQVIRYSLPPGVTTDIINLLHREFCER
jgi:DNA-binding transcriptional ArsR family regulator